MTMNETILNDDEMSQESPQSTKNPNDLLHVILNNINGKQHFYIHNNYRIIHSIIFRFMSNKPKKDIEYDTISQVSIKVYGYLVYDLKKYGIRDTESIYENLIYEDYKDIYNKLLLKKYFMLSDNPVSNKIILKIFIHVVFYYLLQGYEIYINNTGEDYYKAYKKCCDNDNYLSVSGENIVFFFTKNHKYNIHGYRLLTAEKISDNNNDNNNKKLTSLEHQ
jgi:hypothetical protein